MPTLHAIIRTDLCEEIIVETYAKAEDAQLFIERQPDGAPFRIAVLGEQVEPKLFTCLAGEEWSGPTTIEVAQRVRAIAQDDGITAQIYGLVPVEG